MLVPSDGSVMCDPPMIHSGVNVLSNYKSVLIVQHFVYVHCKKDKTANYKGKSLNLIPNQKIVSKNLMLKEMRYGFSKHV